MAYKVEERDRVVTIEGITVIVTKSMHDWYCSASGLYYNTGIRSWEFKVVCRRILGLGPDDHVFDPSRVDFDYVDFAKREEVNKIFSNSPLITFDESKDSPFVEQHNTISSYFNCGLKRRPLNDKMREMAKKKKDE